MADILAAFEELEKEDRKNNPKTGPKPTNTKFRNPLILNRANSSSRPNTQRQGRPTRPRSVPSGLNSRPQTANSTQTDLLSPARGNGNAYPDRSPSVASGRRISFVEGPRPPSTQHRLRILTNRSSLASGFQYDPKLNKYSVPPTEWNDFCNGVIERADLPRIATWAWFLYKSDAIKKVKRDMQYEGSDMKRYFNAWNRNFRRKGFTVSIEVPGPPKIRDHDTAEQKEQVKRESKFFRMVVTPNAEKAGSIYSRTSSLTRAVTNEGLSLQPSKEPLEDEPEGEGKPEDTDEDKAKSEEAEEEVRRGRSEQARSQEGERAGVD